MSEEKDDDVNGSTQKEATRNTGSPVTPSIAPVSSPPAAPVREQIQLDDSKATAAYANFCRVTGTPEELIIDFALNPQPFGTPTEPIHISQRLIVNFYTAKRMLAALSMTLQRHEGAFGVLETDVQKRVLPAAMRQASRG